MSEARRIYGEVVVRRILRCAGDVLTDFYGNIVSDVDGQCGLVRFGFEAQARILTSFHQLKLATARGFPRTQSPIVQEV
jgi:hypothetical protein